MSGYISPAGDYPRFMGDIQLQDPKWQEGQELPDGWIAVEDSALPEVKENQTLIENYPVEQDGKWVRNFTVRDLTADELAQAELEKVKGKVASNQPLTEAEAALLVG